MISCFRDYTGRATKSGEPHAVVIPAVLVWEPVKGDRPVSTRASEKPLHAVMPMEAMLFADAGLQRLEVGVGALHRPTHTCPVRGFEGEIRSYYRGTPYSVL